MRSPLVAGVALAITVSLLTGCGTGVEAADPAETALVGEGSGENCQIDNTVTLGAVFSLEGPAAFAGTRQERGLKLAVSKLNKRDGVRYKLIQEDDKTELDAGLAAFEKLIDSDRVSAIVGPTLSDLAFTVYQDAEQAGVPAIGTSTTAEGIPSIGDYIFRNSLPEQNALDASIPAAKRALGLERVAILSDKQDEYTTSAHTAMKEALVDQNIEIVADVRFKTDDTSFESQLAEVQAANPDALVLSALPDATIPLVKQARELGIQAPIVGSDAFNSPELIDQLGPAAEGLIVGGAWSAEADEPGNADFIDSYRKVFDQEPDQFAAQAYTAAFLIDEAVRTECDGTRDAIKDNLGQILEFETIMGKLSLDEDGEVYQDPVVQIVKDGELTLLTD